MKSSEIMMMMLMLL